MKAKAHISVSFVMIAAARNITNYGFVSKKEAVQKDIISTSDRVQQEMVGSGNSTWNGPILEPTSDWIRLNAQGPDASTADAVVQWAQNVSVKPNDTFLQDAVGTVRNSSMHFWQIPLAITLFETKKRFETAEVAQNKNYVALVAEAAKSEWMGVEKVRADFFVKLVGTKRCETRMGSAIINNLVDQNGNLGVVFSEQPIAQVGDCFLMKATPKSHNISKFHGGKETMFNRIKILQNVGAKTA